MSSRIVPILLYHGVRGCHGDGIQDPLYALSGAVVEKQINWLKKNRCIAVSMSSLFSSERVPENVLLFTVDDGLKSAYTHIFPILKEAGYPATFFPVAGRVGTPGWVNWSDLEEMLRAGMEIGSHSLTHANLAKISPRELGIELVESKKRLEDKLGVAVRYLSLPGGYGSSRVEEMAAEAGYKAICTSVFGYNHTPVDRLRLRRFCLKGNDAEDTLRSIMNHDLFSLFPRYLREKGIAIARAMLGDKLYTGIRSLLIPPGAHSTLPRFPYS